MEFIKTKEDAIKAIVEKLTTPSQIDYVKFSKRLEYAEAETFIEALPELDKQQVYLEIENTVSKYYEPGEDGLSYADLDNMF